MGTRHLTMVYYKGQYKVAQYGQWDGYLECAGLNVLHFLKTANLEKFKKNLDLCRYVDDIEIDKLYTDLGIKAEQFISVQDANKFAATYPSLSRDLGTEVLTHIERAEKEVLLHDSLNFMADGLFCEYAYLIDLDNEELSIYSHSGKTKDKRFEFLRDSIGEGESYDPPNLLKTYKFSNLPYDEEFLALEK